MPELTEKPPAEGQDLFTSGCLLLLVLLADAAAALVVAIVLVARGWSRRGTGSGQSATSAPPVDWAPVLGFGALTLVVAVTAVLLLRIGHQVIGTAQLTACVLLAAYTLGSWP
ncbi:inner-membrane translocator [Streptomyces sp. SP17KL33]|uniref:inner-membrane translocator n=1 Tax=Streptomyces sp. SP17KL33 TaxID=3002534 RepID=UPI002E78322F|nr:inner-membrane translocator [Streptomyces sp. SP17KL33]MEE1832200.1 inner-membrane translocator [Streptomyces sp. SP17KL33]